MRPALAVRVWWSAAHQHACGEAPARFNPSDTIGKKTQKTFPGHGAFIGEIKAVSAEKWYTIEYSDGDVEDVTREVALKGIKRYDLEETI